MIPAPDRRLKLLFGLSFIWAIIVLGGYYLYHKPFTPGQVLIWLRASFQTAVGLGIIACAGGLGEKVLNRFARQSQSPVVQSLGLGLGLLGTISLVVGWVIGMGWVWSLLMLGALLLICKKEILHWSKAFVQLARAIAPNGLFSSCLAVLIGFLLVSSWLTAIAPPLAFDSLVYHLSLPVTYLQAGKFVYVPGNPFWGMPQLGELLYTIAGSIAGMESGQVLGWMIGIIALLGIGELLKDKVSRDDIWVAFSVVLCGLTFVDSLGWGYIDWFTFFWGVCVLQTLTYSNGFPESKTYFLSGVFCGFALGTKYTAGILIIAVYLTIVFFSVKPSPGWDEDYKRCFWNSKVGLIALLSLSCFLTVLPWWVKNWLAVGQPFYPLLYPAGEMSSQRLRFYAGVQPFGSWLTSLFIPITSTILGIEGKEGFNATIGPLFLLLAPFSILFFTEKGDDDKRMIKLNMLFALSGWFIWGVGSRLAGYLIQTRFYWALFPSLVILSVYGYHNLSILRFGSIRTKIIFNSMVVFVLGLTIVEVFSTLIQKRTLQLINGQMETQAYLEHNLGWHYLALDAIHKRKADKTTLLLFEPRNLYCLPNCDGDEFLDEWYLASLDPEMKAESILSKWKEKGYQYVMVFHAGAEFVRKSDRRYLKRQWDVFDQLIPRLIEEQTFGEAYTLYSLP